MQTVQMPAWIQILPHPKVLISWMTSNELHNFAAFLNLLKEKIIIYLLGSSFALIELIRLKSLETKPSSYRCSISYYLFL